MSTEYNTEVNCNYKSDFQYKKKKTVAMNLK